MNQNPSLSFFVKGSIILLWLYVFFYILLLGKDLLIPLILAFFLASSLIRTHHILQEKCKLPRFVSIIGTAILYIGVLSIFAMIINNNVQSIINNAPQYEEKIVQVINGVLGAVGLEQSFSFGNIFNSLNLSSLFSSIGWAMTSILASASTILIYTAFILAEYTFIGTKFTTLIALSPEGKKLWEVFGKIKKDIASYFMIHNFFSASTGIGTYIICLSLGIDFAAFWWLLAFMLNYIPTIGSAMAAVIPVFFSLIQFGANEQWWMVWVLAALLGALQFTMGNVIEPKFLGNKLNLSPLVILLSLTFWWYIWWVVGMFLSIPLMVMVNIACSYFESTKWIHIILSQKGTLDTKK